MLVPRLSSLVAAALLLAGCADNPPGAGVADQTVLTNFTLFDGSGSAPTPDSAMIVESGRIAWIGPAAELDAPEGVEAVDLQDKFVMPGLIDLHVHLAVTEDFAMSKDVYTRENVERELGTYASYGVTAVQVLGTDQDLIFGLRDEQRSGRPKMARVFTAGQGIVFAGGYGGVPGVNQPVATVAEAKSAVAEQAAKGVDLIKLWVDDELGTMPAMPPEISKAVIDAAHNHGLRAIAHIFYLEDAKRLVKQGVDGLAHSVRDKPVDQELIDAMNARGTWQVAETLSREAAMFAYGEPAPFLDDPFFTHSVSPSVIELLASPERQRSVAGGPHFHDYPRFLETAKANLERLTDAGVKIAFGTDSGPPGRFPGYFAHWELELMVEACATPIEALTAATGSAAEFLHADDLGTLEAENWADFIVLNASPVEDIRNTRTISAVYIAGQPIERDAR